MAQNDSADSAPGSCTALVVAAQHVDEGGTTDRVMHHMPFVAQLIAQGRSDLAPYRRRKSDRAGPLQAYATSSNAQTRVQRRAQRII